jgi:hypothetical protein
VLVVAVMLFQNIVVVVALVVGSFGAALSWGNRGYAYGAQVSLVQPVAACQ